MAPIPEGRGKGREKRAGRKKAGKTRKRAGKKGEKAGKWREKGGAEVVLGVISPLTVPLVPSDPSEPVMDSQRFPHGTQGTFPVIPSHPQCPPSNFQCSPSNSQLLPVPTRGRA